MTLLCCGLGAALVVAAAWGAGERAARVAADRRAEWAYALLAEQRARWQAIHDEYAPVEGVR